MEPVMKLPLISVIVPVYNTAPYLERCLQSLLGQTYKNLEIIVIDDGSSDNSVSVCQRYAHENKKIKILQQQHKGPAAARNVGIAAASGQFLGFVDSDDYCAPDMYQELYTLIERHQTPVSAVNYYKVEEEGEKVVSFGFQEKLLRGEEAIISCVLGPQSFPCNKLFAKSLFARVRFPEGMLFEDLAVCYRLYDLAGGVCVSNRPLYYYNRTNAFSVTKSVFSVKKLDYLKASSDLLLFCREKHYNRAEKIVLQERVWHISSFLYQMVQSGFNDKQVISPLVSQLRKHLWLHWTSPHKISNKLFATVCCISFDGAQFFYRILQSAGVHK